MKNNTSPLTEFSAPRHRTIAEVAESFLTPKAAKAVKKLLQKVQAGSLKDIAPWADSIKPNNRNIPTDIETTRFLNKFPNTREWHFVDLPVDAGAYDTTTYAAFTREDDVVHTIIECIHILTGQSNKFSKPNALRWLVHLLGDIHQPLHIACSYIDYSKPKPRLVFKKEEILKKNLLQKSDRGGNKINLPIGSKGKALHSYWDDDLPKKDDDFSDAVYNPPAAVDPDKLDSLPALWVSENVKLVRQAYRGLTVTGRNATHATYVDVSWNRAAYDKRCIPLIKDLSLKAASRLAFLLNTIYA